MPTTPLGIVYPGADTLYPEVDWWKDLATSVDDLVLRNRSEIVGEIVCPSNNAIDIFDFTAIPDTFSVLQLDLRVSNTVEPEALRLRTNSITLNQILGISNTAGVISSAEHSGDGNVTVFLLASRNFGTAVNVASVRFVRHVAAAGTHQVGLWSAGIMSSSQSVQDFRVGSFRAASSEATNRIRIWIGGSSVGDRRGFVKGSHAILRGWKHKD